MVLHRAQTEAVVPRARLAQAVAQGPATPLQPALRRYLETRLAADLGDVRIHTGAAAARLCDALGASALTCGHDILFADGTYAPHTPRGLRLLAHELVHVLQQRGASPRRDRPDVIAVGDATDVCEGEADRLAATVVDGGTCGVVSPDRSFTIRRTAIVLDATAEIALSAANTRPGLDYVQRGTDDFTRMAVLHLTRNKGPVVQGRITSPTAASAIRLTGSVLVQAGLRDTADDIKRAWSFHFIQLFFDMIESASYAGRTASDGSISLNLAGPQHFRGYQNFLIDSDPDDPDKIPYADIWVGLEQVNPQMGLWKAKVINDDHPHTDRPLILENFTTGGKRNYLYSVARQFEVITVLVAVDRNSGAIRPLAHIDWGAAYNAQLPWRTTGTGNVEVGVPQAITSFFREGVSRTGAPTGRGLAALVTNAASATPDDMYNAAIRDALRGVMRSSRGGLDVTIMPGWPPWVPRDHFK